MLATSFFNTGVPFSELSKELENIKNTVKNNLENETEAKEICKIFGLSGDGIFKDLVKAERLKHMDTDEYNLVEKNGVGVHDSQVAQIHQAINPRKKLMTYTELTNTEAYDIVFKQIFDKAKKK